MSIYFKLYLLTLLDGVINFCIVLSILTFISIIIVLVWAGMEKNDAQYSRNEGDPNKKVRKLLNSIKWLLPLALFLIFLSIVIPNKNEAIFIIAGGKTINWIESDTSICKIPS